MPYLFSYGTLQQPEVQLATFSRMLNGHKDDLIGYELSQVAIDDPTVAATSGKTHHPIVRFTADIQQRIAGTVFEITDAELVRADAYEVAAYERVSALLTSGLTTWVYVDARFAPGAF